MTLWFIIFIAYIALQNISQILANSERIVTELDILYGNQGVPLDYSYNDTIIANQSTSAPGCPKSIDGFPWVHYGNPPRCFLSGRYGPCPLRQKMLAEEGSPFGVCACECVVDDIPNFRTRKIKPRYIFCLSNGFNRPGNDTAEIGQFYDSKVKLCFERGTQGPCNEGEIITGVEHDKLECLPTCTLEDGSTGYLEDGSCEDIVVGRASSDHVLKTGCYSDQIYSEILKRCINKRRKFTF